MSHRIRIPLWSLLLITFFISLAVPSHAVAGEGKTIADLPPQTQVGISAAIGLNDSDYHARKSLDGYTAVNSDHRLAAAFAPDGATVARGTDRWTFKLASFGRENDQQPVAVADLASFANRVEYRREQVTEWYVNGPQGLEQGFTIPVRPAGLSDMLLVITLCGSGLTPVATGSGALALTRPDGSEAFRYGGLAAWDADGKSLPVLLALAGSQVSMKVDDRGARYPVTVDPVFQAPRLTLDDGAAFDFFGSAVALSADGNTALVGANTKGIGANYGQGAAYVLIRTGTYWSYQARLIASDSATSDYFGYTVALSGDGGTALVGSYNKTIGANGGQGAAYAFTRSGTTWSQQASLTASDGAVGDYFGSAVALSGDGGTALIGASFKTIGVNVGQGAAYTFTRSGATWSQQAGMIAGDGAANDFFGSAVALSSDGVTALIGAYNKTIGANAEQGAAYVFSRSGSFWGQQARLTASDGATSDNFGYTVAISGDGGTALIGAYNKTIGANGGQGAAYAFIRSGATWSQQARLTASDGAANDYFGLAVALSGDGSTALVGASYKTIGVNANQGAAYAFTRSGATWSQQARLTASDGAADDTFGNAVALSGDGGTALIGAQHKNIGTNVGQGAAYAFTRSGVTWSQQAQLTAGDGAANDYFGLAVALSGDGGMALIGALGKNIGANGRQGAAYVFTRSGATWSQQARLTASDGAADDTFGNAVALSGDGGTALIGALNKTIGVNANQGAAYAFTRSGATWSQQARLTASDGAADDSFGNAVALSGDGGTALIGAQRKNIGTNVRQGAAYAFTRSGVTWSQQARLIASDGAAFDAFGNAVALSGDGGTALVGVLNKNIGTNVGQGAAYAFTRSVASWSQQARLTAGDGAADDTFGYAVALSSDGGTALVGAYYKTIGTNIGQGAAYTFTRSGATWSQQARLTASDGAANDSFGNAVALSGDGGTALIGAPYKTFAAYTHQGAAYTFTGSGANWSQQTRLTASDGTSNDSFGNAVAISGDGGRALVGAYRRAIWEGAAYTFDFFPERCSAGSYDNAGTCTACPSGTYQPMGLQKSCVAAPAGFFAAGTGATSVSACPAGFYQDLPGQAFCSACVAGTLQPASGQAACVPIPKAANSVVYDPLDLLHLYAGIDNAGVYYSTDGGTKWYSAKPQPTNNRVKALVLSPKSTSVLYAATYGGGIFTSTDSGVTWTACANNKLANLNVVSLIIDANGMLYAGTEGGIFSSDDQCTTWTDLSNGLPK